MSDKFQLRVRNTDPNFDDILKDFPEAAAHPQTGAFGSSYYPASYDGRLIDLTFCLVMEGQPILLCLCSELHGTLGYNGLPMRLLSNPRASAKLYDDAVAIAFEHLDALTIQRSIRTIKISDKPSPTLSVIGMNCLDRGATVKPALTGYVDLTGGPTLWLASLRKRFKQYINWGRNNLSITYINQTNCSRASFDRFREFHAHVAGRITRPQASWDSMQAHVASGGGEVIFGEYEGKLAAAALFVDGTTTSIYMTGVFDRELDKPLSHFIMWHGMERARERGKQHFEFDNIFFPGTVDKKNADISYFKRGFTTDLTCSINWVWEPSNTNAKMKTIDGV